MFANTQHAQSSERTTACVREQSHGRGHVPVLETHPHDTIRNGRRASGLFELDDLTALCGRDA